MYYKSLNNLSIFTIIVLLLVLECLLWINSNQQQQHHPNKYNNIKERKSKIMQSTGIYNEKDLTLSEYIPLKDIQIETVIIDLISKVTIKQLYENQHDNSSIESIYLFPLLDDSVITSFQVKINNDTNLKGMIKEMKKASTIYKEAIQKGYSSMIMSQEKPDIFVAKLGNIPPKSKVEVEITFMHTLRTEEEFSCYTLPMTIAPRYTPLRSYIQEPTSEIHNIQYSKSVPYKISSFKLNIRMNEDIKLIQSPSHHFEIKNKTLPSKEVTIEVTSSKESQESEGQKTSLQSRDIRMNEDFVLLIQTSKPYGARAWIEENQKGELASMIVYYPKQDDHPQNEEIKKEIIFVVDTSGSMHGDAILSVKKALELFMRSIPFSKNILINLYQYSSDFIKLFPKSTVYTQEAMERASKFVKGLNANGGTELVLPLNDIFNTPYIRGHEREIIVLTDGEIFNTEEVLDKIKKTVDDNSHGITRVFTMGVGYAVSHYLVNTMAIAGNGISEFVHPGQSLEKTVIRQLKRALYPNYSNLIVQWPSNTYFTAPSKPVLLPDSRIIVHASISNLPDKDIHILSGFSNKPVVTIKPSEITQITGETLHKLAAHARISELSLNSNQYENEIIKLSEKYQILSPYTSFLIVDERRKMPSAEITIYNPTEIVKGWKEQIGSPRIINTNYNYYVRPPVLDSDAFGGVGAYDTATESKKSAPLSDILLLDVMSTSIRIGIHHPTYKNLTVPIIQRNNVIPTKKSLKFTTYKDNQKSVSMRIYAGESMFTGELMLLKEIQIELMDKAKKGAEIIEISAEYMNDLKITIEIRGKIIKEETIPFNVQSDEITSLVHNAMKIEQESKDLQEHIRKNEISSPYQLPDEKIIDFNSLVSLQNAEGNFAWNKELFTVLQLDEEKVRNECNKINSLKSDDKVAATTVVAVLMKRHSIDKREVFQLIFKKIENYLKSKGVEFDKLDKILLV